MEKYSKWTDGSTGINPFVPFGQTIISIPRLLFFFPFIFAKLFVYWICTLMIRYLTSFGLAMQGVVVMLYRVLLFLGGVWNVKELHWNVQLQKEVDSEFNQAKGLNIVLSNHVSYLDVFYFTYKYGNCPRQSINAPDAGLKFITMYVDELNRDVKFKLQNTWEYITQHFYSGVEGLLQYRKASDALTGEELVKKLNIMHSQGPSTVVFFFEGITTNGRGILQYPGNDKQLNLLVNFIAENNIHVDVVALNYGIGNRRNTDMTFNPACHMDSFTSHLLGLFSQFSISFEAKFLHECKDLFANKLLNTRKNIARALPGVHALGSTTLIDKKDFMRYWRKTQGY